jgi:competence protein ComEC
VIDVGQGDCTLIITPYNKKILVDGGGSELGDYDVGENVLKPYLLDRKIKNIDYIMISHFDSDHVRAVY